MKKIIFGILLMAIGAPAIGQKEARIQLEIGKEIPMADEQMLDLDNSHKTLLSQLKTNGLIVVFSCNTCPFVVGNGTFEGWEKDYNDLAKLAAENEIGFVLVNSNEAKRGDEDSFEKMKEHAKKMGYTMPYLIDENSIVADAFGAKTTPHVYMFNGELKLNYKGSIDNSWDSKREELIPYLQNTIKQSVAGDEITDPETAPKGCSIKRN